MRFMIRILLVGLVLGAPVLGMVLDRVAPLPPPPKPEPRVIILIDGGGSHSMSDVTASERKRRAEELLGLVPSE